jgi:ribosomal protein L9
MKIDLIKDHVLGKKGDTVSVSQPRGDYLIRMGVAKLHVAKDEVKEKPTIKESLQVEKPKPKKETKPKTKNKQ